MDSQSELATVTIGLTDGFAATVRPILPTDAPLLKEGFANLSESSRFARFGMGMDHLTKQELRYLTEVDHRTHVAWGALIGAEAAGISRYLVLPDGDSAEVAVTVVDQYQRHGLGRQLFQALIAVARHDRLRAIRFEVEPSNRAVRRLIRDVAGGYPDSGAGQGEVTLVNLPEGEYDEELVALIESYRS